MTGHLVRAYWVTGAVSFVGSKLSTDAGQQLLAGLSRDLRLSLPHLQPADWCPRSQHLELLGALAATQRGGPVYDDLLAYGGHVGREVIDGSMKPFMQIVNLKLLAKKLPAIWARDHRDESELQTDISLLDEARLPLRISGLAGYHAGGVAMLGFIKAAVARLVRRAPELRHVGWSPGQPGTDEIKCEVFWS